MGSALTAVVLGDVFYADDGSPKIVAFRFNDVVEYHDDNHTGGGRANIKPARQANKADANNAHSSESKHSVDLGGMSTNKIGTNHRVAGEPNVNSNSVVVGVRGSDDGGGDTAAHVASAADAAFTSGGVGGAKIRNTSIAANTSNNDSNNGTTHDANSIRNIRNYNYNYNYANQSGDDHLRKTNNAPVGYGQQQFGIVPQIKLEFGGDNVGHTEPSRSIINNILLLCIDNIVNSLASTPMDKLCLPQTLATMQLPTPTTCLFTTNIQLRLPLLPLPQRHHQDQPQEHQQQLLLLLLRQQRHNYHHPQHQRKAH